MDDMFMLNEIMRVFEGHGTVKGRENFSGNGT